MVALVLALFGPCDNYTSLLAFAFTKRMLRAKVSEIALLYTYSICQVLAATSMWAAMPWQRRRQVAWQNSRKSKHPLERRKGHRRLRGKIKDSWASTNMTAT
jgi:hypothetical protein